MTDEKLGLLKIDPYLNPYEGDLQLRMEQYENTKVKLLKGVTLSDFANGYLFYGIHRTADGWIYREWAPNAEKASLVGDFNNWDENADEMTRLENGNWEVKIKGKDTLKNGENIKVRFYAGGRSFDRIPAYINRAVQSWTDGSFCGQVWIPEKPFRFSDGRFFKKHSIGNPIIYECHIGIASSEEKIGTYTEFRENVLPRIKANGYNCIQIMAIAEHPYYASFGYQVANFYAPSSRFGTPEELKELINAAHKMNIGVLLDLVHSHSVKNTNDGLSEFDGTDYQYFHSGVRGIHSAWDTRLFNYGKAETLHFLLSNIKYWIEEYHFDGFRFDGVTSMLYLDHGLGTAFDNYSKYFSLNTDTEAITYLQLANELVHELNSKSITIAEDMSGMPGMCRPIDEGGIGFDYRLSMGAPDFWIKTLKKPDEEWNMGSMWYELSGRRPGEKNIGYCESHDQALVGDKTIMFWLADQEMYWHMRKWDESPVIDRAIALHKMIRLVTASLAGEGYLDFMGNEFGHPEWIDFPRAGNGDSFHYAKRQWNLVDNKDLKYEYLNRFDNVMVDMLQKYNMFKKKPVLIKVHEDDKLLCYRRGELFFVFNFHTWKTNQIEMLSCRGSVERIISTEDIQFGGQQKIIITEETIVLPPRSAVVCRGTWAEK